MKKFFLILLLLSFTAVGCSTVSQDNVTIEATDVPSQETPLEQPTKGLLTESAEEITEEPPHVFVDLFSLGDTQTRPSNGMVMVYVPSGEFEMGSDSEEVTFALNMCKDYDTNCRRAYFSYEEPIHTVALDSFWLDQTEVTFDQYTQCVQAGTCEETTCPDDQLGGDHPVVCVTWDMAASYCEWAGGRLPTEAEWEYAARGVERVRYPWGDEFDGTKLNYCDYNCTLGKSDPSIDDGYATTSPVGSYPEGASGVGALDMSGNVWELVAGWFGDYPSEKQINPTGPETGSRRIARGGSWHTSPDHARSALRTHLGHNDSINHAGFRCAQSVP